MMVYYSPVFSEDKLTYEFNGYIITCYLNGEEYGVYNVEEMVGMNVWDYPEVMPIRAVWMDQGMYWVRLLNYHEYDAPEEVKYPDWIEV